MECGVDGQLDKTLHFHHRHWYPPPGMTLPRRAWVWFNRLCSDVGRFCSCLYKWNMASSAACECGTEEQTVDHVLFCPIHWPPHRLHSLTVLDDWTMRQLNGCSTSVPRSSAAKQWFQQLAQKKKKPIYFVTLNGVAACSLRSSVLNVMLG